ncbi:MAG: hypothetical protein HY908_24585, partial [Myxococcales bacterium]|nr:hypothetical protein [Myxococcales bacterium]
MTDADPREVPAARGVWRRRLRLARIVASASAVALAGAVLEACRAAATSAAPGSGHPTAPTAEPAAPSAVVDIPPPAPASTPAASATGPATPGTD